MAGDSNTSGCRVIKAGTKVVTGEMFWRYSQVDLVII